MRDIYFNRNVFSKVILYKVHNIHVNEASLLLSKFIFLEFFIVGLTVLDFLYVFIHIVLAAILIIC